MNLECDDECTCDVGPFSSCPTCRKYNRDYFDDCDTLPTTTVYTPWSDIVRPRPVSEPDYSYQRSEYASSVSVSPPANKIIKAVWLEAVTESAALFVTKKGCLWIPLAMMETMKRTKKGKYKIEVYPSFTPTYINANHRYFKNPESKK